MNLLADVNGATVLEEAVCMEAQMTDAFSNNCNEIAMRKDTKSSLS